ncbi:MAG: integrin alpha [Candidatus Methylomirabilis sp.]|nr:integrin alpha [Deltaproteobacteria bacterium]
MYPRIRIVFLLLAAALSVAAPASAAVVLRRAIYGEHALDRFGVRLAPAGDADGDGSPDFTILTRQGIQGASLPRDRYYVVSGRDLRLIRRVEATESYHEFTQADGLGDWDGDGRDDLWVREEGAYDVRRGATGESLRSYPWTGERTEAQPAGDLDGDGVTDFVFRAPFATNPEGVRTGRVDVFSGADGAVIRTHYGERAFDDFGSGTAFSGRCDMNGDGTPDFLVGASGFDHGILGGAFDLADAGKVYVFSGADGSLLFSAEGEAPSDALGSSVSTAGRVDADAKADVAAGAPGFDGTAGADAGKVYVFAGATGALYSSVEGEQAGAKLGAAVARAGNVNGDGKDDLVVGAPGYFKSGSGGGADTGRAYPSSMFVPPPPGPCATAEGARPSALALYALPFAALLLLRARRRIG